MPVSVAPGPEKPLLEVKFMSSIEQSNHNPINGRFTAGNRAGIGNVLNRRYHEHRKEWLDAGSEDERTMIRAKVVELAKGGDMAAIKFWADMTYGKLADKIEFSGPDGDPVKIDMAKLTTVILGALAPLVERFPEAQPLVGRAILQLGQATESRVQESGTTGNAAAE
jgi:hypothetical protein